VFRIVAGDGSSRLLRVGAMARRPVLPDRVPPDEVPPGGVSLQAAILLHLASAAPRLPVQRVIASLDGQYEVVLTEVPPADLRLARMTSWLDGEPLGGSTVSRLLRRDIGATLARLSLALRGFTHPDARRTHWWDLQQLGRLRPLLADLPPSGMLPEVSEALGAGEPAVAGELADGGGLRAALGDYLDRFDAVVRPRLACLPVQVIHTDFHGLNLLGDGTRITGILDFGDALTGPVAMDVAVAACYQLGTGTGALTPALDVVAGYHAVDPLDDADLELAAELIVARIVARIIVSQWNALRDPANRGYLLRRTPQAVEHYTALRRVGAGEIAGRLRAACS
jgi:Ser/Thr protein kinase RdoA (MazF antagonist)